MHGNESKLSDEGRRPSVGCCKSDDRHMKGSLKRKRNHFFPDGRICSAETRFTSRQATNDSYK